jgi:SAM-dependent methyltransferase
VLGNSYRNRLFGTHLRPSLAVAGWVAPLFRNTAARIRQEDRGLGPAHDTERRLLDVGCGRGEFFLCARQLGWRCYGVEFDGTAAALARQYGGEILGSQVQDLGPAYHGFFDAITVCHVIEHVYDPLELLRLCRRLLRPGGYLWVETPNAESVGYELYGSHWRGLEPPRHLVLFNTLALRMSLERAGFERTRSLEPREVTERLFLYSEAIRLGLIAEKDQYVLSRETVARAKAAARRARAATRRDPRRSEFITMIAYRPTQGE